MEDGLNRAQRYFFGLELCRTSVLPVLNGQKNIRMLGRLGPFGSEGCCVQRLCDCPTPTCNPEKGCILPAWLLTVSAVLPFPQQEVLSSWSLLRSPCLPVPDSGTDFFLPGPAGPWPPRLQQGSRGRRQAGVRKARVHTSTSLCCQQSWGHHPTLGHGDPGVRRKRPWCSHSRGKAGI